MLRRTPDTIRPMGSGRRLTYSANTLGPRSRNQPYTHVRSERRPDRGYYQPNERLFDRESVLDSITGGEYGSDSELSDNPLSLPRRDTDSHTNKENEGPASMQQTFSCSQQQGTNSPEIIAMLQEQHRLLREVLSTQEVMQRKQKDFNRKLEVVEQQVSKYMQSTESASSSGSSGGKKKCRVTRDLTKKVTAVHDALDEGFNESESSTSVHNSSVRTKIISEICSIPGNTYTEDNVRAAVQRKYESLRRQWKAEEKDGHDELQKQIGLKKKYRQRRKRKFDNRAVVIQEGEMRYWRQLSVDYMTEESDDPEDPYTLVVHPLPWRSQRLCGFLDRLDQRYDDRVKKEGITMAKKNRKTGFNSTILPPSDAPDWTLDQEWKDNHPKD